MAKFPFKRPRIISKKFPELDSSIDGVTKSLDDLVFSYHEQVQNALTKKHWLMAFSSIALLLVLGSFISMKGKAESSIFYPETCLGGWINPQNAQGEQQTTSNGDESQFTKDNSAVLPKNTNAEMYCGNFKGKFDSTTKPTKIIVSLALTKGNDIPLDSVLVEDSIIATSTGIIDMASSTATTTLQLASSIDESTEVVTASTTDAGSSTLVDPANLVDKAIATPGSPKDEGPSIIDGVVKSVQDTIDDLFGGNDEKVPQTDTVVVPLPAPSESTPTPTPTTAPAPEAQPVTLPESPTSFLPSVTNVLALLFVTVFAQEEPIASPATDVQITPQTPEAAPVVTVEPLPIVVAPTESVTTATQTEQEVVAESIAPPLVDTTVLGVATATEQVVSTTTVELMITSTSTSSTTDIVQASSTDISATTTEQVSDDNQSQNNFLEVFYTFDGKTWQSLGILNEISMKYRTFEIPVTESTSWADMSKLQIKIESKKQDQDTPMVYLDGVRVDVLYETTIEHAHPDFKRDTILKDEVFDGMRVVTIINNDTNREEVWYMYLESENASSSNVVSTSTNLLATSSLEALTVSTSTDDVLKDIKSKVDVSTSSISSEVVSASSTVLLEVASTTVSSTTPYIKPVVPKNTWLKFDGIAKGYTLENLVSHIKKVDEIVLDSKEQEDRIPDFTKDTIRKIKGMLANAMVVQVEKDAIDELWIYDVEKGTQEKISVGSSTSVSSSFPIGLKEGSVFWLSKDEGTIFAYSIDTKLVQSKIVPPHNSQEGERVRIAFDGIPWVAVVGADGFYFFSETTGEVFSDDNSLAVEEFRKKMKLDEALSGDEIDALNLIQNENAEEPTE